MTEKIIGILGGMGPEATADFFQKIVSSTRAARDSDHIPIVIYNNPKIPDRSRAILEGGPSPLPMLKEGARFLQDSGADLIVMPCVTAHMFYQDLADSIDVPILNLIDETIDTVCRHHITIKKLGLLATAGTYETGIWDDPARLRGIQIITPEHFHQKLLMDVIYGDCGIKAGCKGSAGERVLQVIGDLEKAGADAVVLGCTELSLVSGLTDAGIPVANPLVIGSRLAVHKMGYPLTICRSPALVPC